MERSYPPISDYALIGDCRSAALISRAGSLDWLCWPRFDSSPVFAALLDAQHGGRWLLTPRDVRQSTRSYVEDTNVLETRFLCAGGEVSLTDLMPVASEEFKRRQLVPEHEIVRQLDCTQGEVEIELEFAPGNVFGVRPLRLRPASALGVRVEAGRGTYWLRSSVPLQLTDCAASARFRLRAGESAQFSFTYCEDAPAVLPPLGDATREAIARSVAWWRNWIGQARYEGPAPAAVRRSALALKLMSYAPSGAVVAAPTTSLPERIGDGLNWDYRFCWLRDASLTVRALLGLGFEDEVEAFMGWLVHATRLSHPQLHVLYNVYGRRPPRERELPQLEGYAGSRPVREGNAARDQLQLDVYGELLDAVAQWALHLKSSSRHADFPDLLRGHFDRGTGKALLGFGQYVCEHWRLQDEGIWEPRQVRRSNTHSRLLCWTALDRLVTMAEKGFIRNAPVAAFRRERDCIARDIHHRAWKSGLRSYSATFEGEEMDATLLLMSWYGFEHADSPRMRATYHRLRQDLGAGDLIYRYKSDPPEGAFGICSFWEIEHLALGGGSLQEASDLFHRVLHYRNDVGLMAEEYDARSGAALGNFPQAYTHVGLISAALSIHERATGKISLAHREHGAGAGHAGVTAAERSGATAEVA